MSKGITKDDAWFVGEDQNIEWDIRTRSGTPVDISGWTIQFRMALTNAGASVFTKSLTQVDTSRCRMTVAAADTSGLAAFNYFYDLSRTDSGFNQVLDDDRAWLQARVT